MLLYKSKNLINFNIRYCLLFIFLIFLNQTAQALEQNYCRNIFLKERIFANGSDLVTQQSARYQTNSEKYGFRDKEYLKDIERISKRDPYFRKISRVFEEKQYTFAVDQSPDIRSQILEHGFLNVHQTNNSAGVSNVKYRSIVESQYLGMDFESYDKLPKDLKPKSMYLVPTVESGIDLVPTLYHRDTSTQTSFADTWIFDLDKIKSNVLFVIGDSFDRLAISRFDIPYTFGTIYDDATISGDKILDYLLPLSMLKMSVPYFYHEVKKSNKLQFRDVFSDEFRQKKQELYDTYQNVKSQFYAIDFTYPELDMDFFNKFPELWKHRF